MKERKEMSEGKEMCTIDRFFDKVCDGVDDVSRIVFDSEELCTFNSGQRSVHNSVPHREHGHRSGCVAVVQAGASSPLVS